MEEAMTITRVFCGMWALGLLVGCGGGAGGPADGAGTGPTANPNLSAMARLGELIFHDRNLSGSGRMSCATCHDPERLHGPPNAQPVQVGGQFETEFGQRAAPSLRYLAQQPAFDALQRRGGLMADGRVDTLAQQALLPWFSPLELDNGSVEALARKLRAAPYAAQFTAHFGASDDAGTTVARMAQAVQAFQQDDPRLRPFDSKFDQVAAGRDRFSPAEQRGREIFDDPARGNCAACHPSRTADGRPPLFTDFGYAALGVPRNATIPHNADPGYFDLGLCGPLRTDLPQATLCGLFRTPGLRNVAQRPVYFHNGVFTSLAEVVAFYNTRDTQPQRWYPSLGGVLQAFDDLPAPYRANLTQQAPLDGRPAGSAPAMNDAETADLVCFLRTLSDGHVAGTPPPVDCR
jgi:cytochrome c peroxidase